MYFQTCEAVRQG